MINILKFKQYNEGYLDIDFECDPKRVDKTTYLINIDGEKFKVAFHPQWDDDDPDCEMSDDYNTYERQYYYRESNGFNPFKENIGIDPRKVVIGVTRATIDFLERNKPRKLFIENLDMIGEEGKRLPNSFNKRNKINYYYLEKMLPDGWDIERSTNKFSSFTTIVRKKNIFC
jgi:hypothetical protein